MLLLPTRKFCRVLPHQNPVVQLEIAKHWRIWRPYRNDPGRFDRLSEEDVYDPTVSFPAIKPEFATSPPPLRCRSQRGWYQVHSPFGDARAGTRCCGASESKLPATAFAPAYAALYKAIQPSAAPTNTASAASSLASVHQARPSDPLAAGADLLLSGQ